MNIKMEIEIEIGDLDNLRRLQREYFTQNRRSTRTPIYLVQSETELACADDRGNSVGYWLIDDNEDEDPCLFRLTNHNQNETDIREEIEEIVINDMEYYGKSDEEIEDKKKEMIEKTAQEFQKLNGDNQMFILGYMLGIQQERQRTTPQPQTA